MHGKVPLVSFVQPSRNRIYESTDSLFIRLKKWMAPEYVFDYHRKRFVRADSEVRDPGGRQRLEIWRAAWRD